MRMHRLKHGAVGDAPDAHDPIGIPGRGHRIVPAHGKTADRTRMTGKFAYELPFAIEQHDRPNRWSRFFTAPNDDRVTLRQAYRGCDTLDGRTRLPLLCSIGTIDSA